MDSSSSGELTVPSTTSTGNTGTGSGTSPPPGGIAGTNPTSRAGGNSQNTVSLASLLSSAQTNEDNRSVSQQIQLQNANQIYLRSLFAALRQGQAAANAKATRAHGGGTSGVRGASTSLHGAQSTDGVNRQTTTAGSGSTAGSSSANSANTSLIVSKRGPLLPALILALVLACGVTAMEVRRRTRRAAGVPSGGDGSPPAGD